MRAEAPMDVLAVVLGIVVILIAGFFVLSLLHFAFLLLPFFIAVPIVGYFIDRGHDNLAALAGIAGLVAGFIWFVHWRDKLMD
jgi:hypothetical protein